MNGPPQQPPISEFLERRDLSGLREALSSWESPDIAVLVGELPVEQRGLVFRILPRALAAETFECLDPEDRRELVDTLAQNDLIRLLEDMAPDDRTALFEELPAVVSRALLAQLSSNETSTIRTHGPVCHACIDLAIICCVRRLEATSMRRCDGQR